MMLFSVPQKTVLQAWVLYIGIHKVRTIFMQSTRNGVIGGKKSE